MATVTVGTENSTSIDLNYAEQVNRELLAFFNR